MQKNRPFGPDFLALTQEFLALAHRRPRKMQTRAAGGLTLPVLTLGTWSFGDPTGTYAKQSEEVFT